MTEVFNALAGYIAALDRSAHETHRAEDRRAYTEHLAAAARCFVMVHAGRITELRALIASERRAYGTAYLSGAEGSAAEKAFDDFARVVEAANAT